MSASRARRVRFSNPLIMELKTMRKDLSFENLTRTYMTLSRISALLPFKGLDSHFIVSHLHTVFMLACTMTVIAMSIVYNIETMATGRPWKAEELYFTILGVGLYFRYYVVLWRRREFVELFEDCHQLWESCDDKGRMTARSFEKRIRIFYGIYGSNCLMTNILLPIRAYFTRLPPLEPNGTEIRVLPYAWFTEDEPYKLLGYEKTFFLQLVAAMGSVVCGTSCEATSAALIMLTAGYFSLLRARLEEIDGSDEPRSELKEIMSCVKYHQKLLDYCTKLKKFSQTLLLPQLLTSGWSISLVLIKLAGSDPGKYDHVPVMLVCTTMAFIVQWSPDQVARQSQAVAHAVYTTLTKHLHDKHLCRDLRIMLTRAQVPVQFMAGGFFELSLENLTSMIKGVYSFFTVLRKFDI